MATTTGWTMVWELEKRCFGCSKKVKCSSFIGGVGLKTNIDICFFPISIVDQFVNE